MKRNERIFRHCLCFLLAICCIVPVCSGCRRQEERRNLGVDDGIESFLFNFDSRDEVAALVKDVKRGVFPQSLSWHYDRNIMAKKNQNSIKKSKYSNKGIFLKIKIKNRSTHSPCKDKINRNILKDISLFAGNILNQCRNNNGKNNNNYAD